MTTTDNFLFHTLSNCTFLLYDVASIIARTLSIDCRWLYFRLANQI